MSKPILSIYHSVSFWFIWWKAQVGSIVEVFHHGYAVSMVCQINCQHASCCQTLCQIIRAQCYTSYDTDMKIREQLS